MWPDAARRAIRALLAEPNAIRSSRAAAQRCAARTPWLERRGRARCARAHRRSFAGGLRLARWFVPTRCRASRRSSRANRSMWPDAARRAIRALLAEPNAIRSSRAAAPRRAARTPWLERRGRARCARAHRRSPAGGLPLARWFAPTRCRASRRSSRANRSMWPDAARRAIRALLAEPNAIRSSCAAAPRNAARTSRRPFPAPAGCARRVLRSPAPVARARRATRRTRCLPSRRGARARRRANPRSAGRTIRRSGRSSRAGAARARRSSADDRRARDARRPRRGPPSSRIRPTARRAGAARPA
ncbi:Uncharacterised protein [Burkholderia pseudomallei]|nr:Uncharacterised protein [Burkholderia pseudomallei]